MIIMPQWLDLHLKEVGSYIEKNKVITEDLALGTIKATKAVTEEIVNSLNKEKDARINDLKRKTTIRYYLTTTITKRNRVH